MFVWICRQTSSHFIRKHLRSSLRHTRRWRRSSSKSFWCLWAELDHFLGYRLKLWHRHISLGQLAFPFGSEMERLRNSWASVELACLHKHTCKLQSVCTYQMHAIQHVQCISKTALHTLAITKVKSKSNSKILSPQYTKWNLQDFANNFHHKHMYNWIQGPLFKYLAAYMITCEVWTIE